MLQSLQAHNPWWNKPVLPSENAWKQRLYFPALKRYALDFEIRRSVVLLGARRSGKTVMIKQLIAEAIDQGLVPAQNVCFAPIDYRGLRGANPLDIVSQSRKVALPNKPRLVVIDEIQQCDDWERDLKSLTDMEPDVKIVVTGSVASALKRKSIETGTGRFFRLNLPPMLFCEFLLLSGKWPSNLPNKARNLLRTKLNENEVAELNKSFFDYLEYGAYPEAAFNQAIAKNPEFIEQSVPSQDEFNNIAPMYGISPDNNLYTIFLYIAKHNGRDISVSTMSKESGISINTIVKYLVFLEAAFLIRRIGKMNYDLRNLARNTGMKYCLENPSMHRYVINANDPSLTFTGHSIEAATIVQYQSNTATPKISCCRFTRNKKEVEIDMIHHRGGFSDVLRLTEIKWSDKASHLSNAAYNLNYLARQTNKLANDFEGCYCTTKSTYNEEAKDKNITYLPTAQYCLALGLESLAQMRC